MLKKRIILGLIGVFLLLISFIIIPKMVFANPDDITLYVIEDAFVFEINPDTNYGSHINLIVGTKISGNQRSFVKFDLNSLSGATIILATLRLKCHTVTGLSPPDTNVEARRISDDSWTELGITWTNQKDYGIIEDTQVPVIDTWVEWDITDYVDIEMDGDEIVSVCLKSVFESTDTNWRQSYYHSRDYNGGSAKPELYIEYSVVSDEKPFYSNIGYNDVTQVGESADFSIFWEDDFALETCEFSTNNTGIWKNDTLTVSGISSWANITIRLNFTASVRIEWKWFCMDNASQWNDTSTYNLTTTPLYITFNFNNSTMGKFYVDYVNTANGTQNSYDYDQNILLDGIIANSNYTWLNFTWTGGNSVTNNYEYYTSGNNTVWCYFGLSGVGGIDENFFVLGFVLSGCAVLFIIIVIKDKRKKV